MVDQVRDDNIANGDRWDGRREDRQDNMWDRQDSVERHHDDRSRRGVASDQVQKDGL